MAAKLEVQEKNLMMLLHTTGDVFGDDLDLVERVAYVRMTFIGRPCNVEF